MKEIIIIAGPNGAGKTSFVNQFFPFEKEALEFVNADEIARSLSAAGLTRAAIDLRASREMLLRISNLVSSNAEFIFETTLASLAYAQKIPHWQAQGYTVHIIYLRLPNAEAAVERVRRRVAAGGHSIPEAVIRSRYAKSLDYLERLYKPIVDEWYVWNSLEGDFKMSEAWDD
ncbi:MAG: AAA family ATPase [Hyphomicrobiaceae bacterium]